MALLFLLWTLPACESPTAQEQCVELGTSESAPVAILDQLSESPPLSCSLIAPPEPMFDIPVLRHLVASNAERSVIAYSTTDGLFWATLNLDREMGEPTKISDDGFPVKLLADAQGVALVWTVFSGKTQTSTLSLLPESPGPTADFVIASSPATDFFAVEGGYGVLLRDEGVDKDTRFVRVGYDGQIRSEMILLQEPGVRSSHARFSDEEIIVAYSDEVGCHLRILDMDANILRSTLLREASATEFGQCKIQDLISTEEGWLVALETRTTTCDTHFNIEFQRDEPAQEQHIELVRVDKTGGMIDTPIPLSTPESNIREMAVRLKKTDEGIALMWSRGSVIYVCGGCIGDDELHFAILSEYLRPLSYPLVMKSTPLRAQMSPGQIAIRNNTLLLAFRYQFHASGRPGMATVQCTAN